MPEWKQQKWHLEGDSKLKLELETAWQLELRVIRVQDLEVLWEENYKCNHNQDSETLIFFVHKGLVIG